MRKPPVGTNVSVVRISRALTPRSRGAEVSTYRKACFEDKPRGLTPRVTRPLVSVNHRNSAVYACTNRTRCKMPNRELSDRVLESRSDATIWHYRLQPCSSKSAPQAIAAKSVDRPYTPDPNDFTEPLPSTGAETTRVETRHFMRVCASLPRAEKTNVIEADGPEPAAPILGS